MKANSSIQITTDVADLLDELTEQDYASVSAGWSCSTNTFTLSNHVGNNGWLCTITVECIKIC